MEKGDEKKDGRDKNDEVPAPPPAPAPAPAPALTSTNVGEDWVMGPEAAAEIAAHNMATEIASQQEVPPAAAPALFEAEMADNGALGNPKLTLTLTLTLVLTLTMTLAFPLALTPAPTL